jgi:hypothetical protein
MTGHRFQDIWKEQCEAARSVRDRYDLVAALDYLIGEKLLNYAETAVTRPEFARQMPRFVAGVRAENDGDFFMETGEQRMAARARLAQIKDLLTSRMLGTG